MEPNNITNILERGTTEVIEKDSLKKRLESGKKLRVKLGIDPTGPDLHLGHAVTLLKLRQFQDLGHTAVLIIGDYTASIGDPSGKDKTRPPLSADDIKNNYKTYKKQALKVLNKKNLEIRKQSEWYKKFNLSDFLKLTAQVSVGHLLSHETFRKRIETDAPFSTHELLYPFLQGYDSVAVSSDIEIGASEQKFNLLMGRVMQKYYKIQQQDIIITPYLLGTDGKEKMGKTLNNYIGLTDEPSEMFGKVMSIHDDQIIPYFELATQIPKEKLEEIKKSFTPGPGARDLKQRLAETITAMYWGDKKAQEAAENFVAVFKENKLPQDIQIYEFSEKEIPLTKLLVKTGVVESMSEAKRQIKQGSVRVGGEKKENELEIINIEKETTLSVGKRRVARVVQK